jgi:TonB family protein
MTESRVPSPESRLTLRLPPPAFRLPLVTAAVFVAALPLLAQNRGAQLVRQPKPVYPETLAKGLRQGNVVLIGRVDPSGKVQDTKLLTTSHLDFVEPALKAVRDWEFKPATRNGRPISIAANIALRFRQEGAQRGTIPRPTLGDLAVFPAGDAGAATGPEGFPIHAGVDPRLRAEAVLDVTPSDKPHSYPVKVQAVSPAGKRFTVYESSVPVAARAIEARIPFSVKIPPDWEDGVWLLRFTVDGTDAGGGQFWLARDPSTYDFVTALKNRRVN